MISNSATEHDMPTIIISFHSESTAHFNDINISYCKKLTKIGEDALIIDLVFHQNLVIFTICSKH